MGYLEDEIARLATQVLPGADAVKTTNVNQNIDGTKTFLNAPVVPDGSFAQAKVTGLVTSSLSTVYLSDALAVPNLATPAQQLETFLNSCSGKRVIFPRGRTYTLEKQLILSLTNAEIDFNGATFTVPNGYAPANRTVSGIFFGNAGLGIAGSSNLRISNFTHDGNKANVAGSHIGLCIGASSDIVVSDVTIKNTNYHAIVVATGTPRLTFEGINFVDNCGAGNSSDVYVENGAASQASFDRISISRVAGIGNWQGFYVNGYNTSIRNLRASGVEAAVVDYRHGYHTLHTMFADNCSTMLITQSADGLNLPEVTATDLFGTDITGGAFACGVYIVTCQMARLQNINVSFAPASANRWYGVRVRSIAGSVQKNVTLRNLYCKNESIGALKIEAATHSGDYEHITCGANDATARTVHITGTAVNHAVRGVVNDGLSASGIYDPDGRMVRNLDPYLSLGEAEPNTVFRLPWNGSAWTFRGVALTARPSARTDLYFDLYGAPAATADPAWMLANDSRTDV